MSDLAIIYRDGMFDLDLGDADLSPGEPLTAEAGFYIEDEAGDLLTTEARTAETTLARTVDETLRTAVIISLFTDRRADAGDPLPDGGGTDADRRGWWGDISPDVDGDKIGSRLWLLDREKQTASVMRRAETYAAEALAWMTEDKVAAAVAVTAENPSQGVLALGVTITRPDGRTVDIRIANIWEAESAL